MAAPLSPAPAGGAGTAVGDPTAVLGRRVVAFLIDAVVVAAPAIALLSTQLESYTEPGMDESEFCDQYTEQYDGGVCVALDDTAYFDDGGFDIASLAPLAISLLLFVIVQGITGWTVGKLITGIRTVKEDGRAVGIPRALVRWILLVVDSLPCLGLLGLITAGTTTGHRRVGDMAAKSYVVRRTAAGSPIVLPSGHVAPGSSTPYAPGGTWSSPAGAPAPAATSPDPTTPQWDAARGTYIQWDPAQSRWVQWDETSRTWTPIPGQ